MFTEAIKLVPTIDRGALNSMFQNLSQRFSSVARKFGDGMKNALKFGGIVGIASALISKLVNPLQKAEEIIDRILNKGDDAVTYAEEFNSDPGSYLRLAGLAKTRGLDEEQLRTLVGKFQGALAREQEAATAPARIQKKLDETSDPLARQQLQAQLSAAKVEAAKGGLLHEFIDEKDMVQGFYRFVQSLRAVGEKDKAQQTVAEMEVFGERIRGRAAEFLNAKDDAEVLKGFQSREILNAAALKAGKISDLNDLLTAKREQEDFVTKTGLMNEGQVVALDKSKRIDEEGENESLKRFDETLSASIAIQELTLKFDKFATDFVNKTAPVLVNGINTISKVAEEFMPEFRKVEGILSVGFDKVLEFAAGVSQAFGDPAGAIDRAKNAVNDFVSPMLPSVSQETQDTIQESLLSVANTIDKAAARIESIWGEFTSSRIYRTFGGGK